VASWRSLKLSSCGVAAHLRVGVLAEIVEHHLFAACADRCSAVICLRGELSGSRLSSLSAGQSAEFAPEALVCPIGSPVLREAGCPSKIRLELLREV
jgi:hypothetical protein